MSVALALALAACTTRSAHDSKGPSAPVASADGGDGGDASDAEIRDGSTRPPADGPSVPDQLRETTWVWQTMSGARTLSFASDGSYTSDAFLDAHPDESCGIEYLTHGRGLASFSATTLVLSPGEVSRKKTDSCTTELLAEDALEPAVETYTWRLDEALEVLALRGEDGAEYEYSRAAK